MNNFLYRLCYLVLVPSLFFACKPQKPMINIAGSDTMIQVVQKLSVEYMKQHPDSRVSVRSGGSATGFAALISGTVQIASASRFITAKEQEHLRVNNINIIEHIIGFDSISVLVNHNNPVRKLTIQQLAGIYTGQINNWSQLGGKDEAILAVARDSNSGTHLLFKKDVLRLGNARNKQEYASNVVLAVSSQQIVDMVKKNPRAIGYVGLGWVTKENRLVEISKDGKNFIAPSIVSTKKGSYPLARTLLFYTNEKYHELNKSFISFTLSQDGQNILKTLGFAGLEELNK